VSGRIELREIAGWRKIAAVPRRDGAAVRRRRTLARRGHRDGGSGGERAERARLYFRFKLSRFPLGADPDLLMHRAYGLPVIERDDNAAEMIERAAQRLAGELHIEAPPGQGRAVVDAADDFKRLPSDAADRVRHQPARRSVPDRSGRRHSLVLGRGSRELRSVPCNRRAVAADGAVDLEVSLLIEGLGLTEAAMSG
jgi:hypothetical protein